MFCYTCPTNRRALTPREYGSFTSDAVPNGNLFVSKIDRAEHHPIDPFDTAGAVLLGQFWFRLQAGLGVKIRAQ